MFQSYPDKSPKFSMSVGDGTWAYIGMMVRDINTIDLCEARGLRNPAGPDYFWKYRRVPKSLLFGGRHIYRSVPMEVEPPVPSWPWRSINWFGLLLRNIFRA
ncbi:hypothetical protein TWF506_000328 [Arthrobotrys conoides]|uniref:Uncharacterized protein n=1 Tax=Arthrobotrys conoides TaxID=74498 RepID=A0AAN8S0U2_9PEZI